MNRLPHNLQQRADELRRAAHHAHVDGQSRRSAGLNRAASVLESGIDAKQSPGLTADQFTRLRAQLRGEVPW